MESLQKKLATARETTDYEALEVVQKTIDNLQRQFQDEVPKLQDAFPCFCVHFFFFFLCSFFFVWMCSYVKYFFAVSMFGLLHT